MEFARASEVKDSLPRPSLVNPSSLTPSVLKPSAENLIELKLFEYLIIIYI